MQTQLSSFGFPLTESLTNQSTGSMRTSPEHSSGLAAQPSCLPTPQPAPAVQDCSTCGTKGKQTQTHLRHKLISDTFAKGRKKSMFQWLERRKFSQVAGLQQNHKVVGKYNEIISLGFPLFFVCLFVFAGRGIFVICNPSLRYVQTYFNEIGCYWEIGCLPHSSGQAGSRPVLSAIKFVCL